VWASVAQEAYLRFDWQSLRAKHLTKLQSQLYCVFARLRTKFDVRVRLLYHTPLTKIMTLDRHIIDKFCNTQLSGTENAS
jgi:hypothetical protein